MLPYTVNVCGPERRDGEKPHTIVVQTQSMAEAKRAAWLWFVWTVISECGHSAADGTIPGRPDLDHLVVSKYDDVVIINTPTFRCHHGPPFLCGDPRHDATGAESMGFSRRIRSCSCTFNWYWVDGSEIDINRLRELGYRVPDAPPEQVA